MIKTERIKSRWNGVIRNVISSELGVQCVEDVTGICYWYDNDVLIFSEAEPEYDKICMLLRQRDDDWKKLMYHVIIDNITRKLNEHYRILDAINGITREV